MTSSAKWFLPVLVAVLGTRQAFSSTRARFSLLAILLMGLSLFPQTHAGAQTVSFGTATVADQTFGLPGTGCSGTYSATVSLTLPEATGTGTITYTLSGQPSGLSFTASSRTLSGTLAADLKQASAVSHTLTYTATSGSASDSLTFKVAIVDERPALEALYSGTNGANWTTSTNWAADISDATCLEDLYNVSLDATTGRVSTLYLDSNQLSGSIPPELGDLTNLTDLQLQGNQLSGSIPPELGNLVSLTTLHLYSNQLSGPIPPELGNLNSLTILWLYSNQLSESIPPELGDLNSLTRLYLHDNQLSGSIPSELGNLNSLTNLYLNDNQLSGSIPSELGNLNSLTRLYLYTNQLSGSIPPELGDLNSLTILYLDTNQLSGEIPPQLGDLDSLTDLDLRGNQLSGEIPSELGDLDSLTYLYLGGNQLSGSIPPELGDLASLTDLWLYDNQLSGSIPSELGNLNSLTDLRLHENQLSGTLEGLNNLNPQYLYLHNNQLSGPIPEFPNATTDHFRLSLYGNAGLYGYPAALNNRSLLRLVAPGDGSAVCLPTTQDGTDCTVPTLVDNLRVEASAPNLVFSWASNPADPAPGSYVAEHILPSDTAWNSQTVTVTTVTVPDTIDSFLVRTTDAPQSPRLYWVPGFSPPLQLSIDSTPPCGSAVADTSVPLSYALVLTPASDTEVPAERRVVADYYTEWLSALPIEASAGRSIWSTDNSFPHLRRAFPGFRGFEFRLTDAPGVTAQCFWTFTEDPAPPQPPPGPTGGGPSPGEPSARTPDSARCGETDREYLESFYEALDGEDWNENGNWNSRKPLGKWHGVETDDAGEVVSLRLSGNNLSGEMPTEELLCLDENTELKELALWDNNDLSGEVPEKLVLAVERAVLRDIAEMLNLNPEWFEDYEDPFNFEDWHEGVTTDDDGRVTELDFTVEEITGEIPESVSELRRLEVIRTGCGITLEAPAPEGVSVMMPDDCAKETAASGGGGCALSPQDNSSAFSLFLLTLVVFAALGRRAR